MSENAKERHLNYFDKMKLNNNPLSRHPQALQNYSCGRLLFNKQNRTKASMLSWIQGVKKRVFHGEIFALFHASLSCEAKTEFKIVLQTILKSRQIVEHWNLPRV